MIWALAFGCVAVSPSGDVLAPRRDAAAVAQVPPSVVASDPAPAGLPPAGTFDFDADARPAAEMGDDTDTDTPAIADAALSAADAARGMGLAVPAASATPVPAMPSVGAFGGAGWGIRLVSTVADAQPPRAILGLPDGRELVVTPGTLLPDAHLVVMAVGRDMVQIAEVTPVGDHADVVSRTLTPMYPR